jgi:hypothetical protein
LVKLITHHILSLGITALISWGGGWTFWIPALGSAWLTDLAIDNLGHERRGYWSRRTPLTHSVLTAPAWGLLTGIIVGILTRVTFTALNLPIQVGRQETIIWGIIGGLTASICHLFADSTVEGGIYLTRSRRWKLAGIHNNSTTVNLPLALIGLTAFATAFNLLSAQTFTQILLATTLALAVRITIWRYNNRKKGNFRRDHT